MPFGRISVESSNMNSLPRALCRRSFLKTTSTVSVGLALGYSAFSTSKPDAHSPSRLSASDLPKGTAPRPVQFHHFPDRLHAFVWRNWPLVPVGRMAAVVGARQEDILRMGQAMGLGDPPRITRDQQRRSYITVIRRNWHLLSYEQLLDLLEWTPDEMAYALREDDFLFIKLGSLKPQCEPLKYESPDQKALERERAIGQIIREEFPRGISPADDSLFSFVARLSSEPVASGVRHTAPAETLRFCYSYFALYGDPLLDAGADPYPDGYLARLAQVGINGVWLQAVLYKLAPFPWEPELSASHAERLKNLQSLVIRARKHGIRVFLYLNEPRAMPLRFFQTRPDMKGVVEGDHAALCTCNQEVQKFLVESVAAVCRAVPDLGGFFTITGSENLTNCWSHGAGNHCPRCSQRPAADVIAEVNRLFSEGIHRAVARVQLIVWDWGWDDAWAGEIIRQLPSEASLMSVSEWSLPIEPGGVKSTVGEYSISAIGPGPRAQRHWELARQRGLKTIAKIQAGNTWELSAVPWIPAVDNVARHAANLRASQVNGVMMGWTLGGYPSPNLEVVAEVLAGGSADRALQQVAERRVGQALAPRIVTAWREFSKAFREFPFHVDVVYFAPQQFGPANPLWAKPTHYSASMTGFPYDDLDAWRAVYPPGIFIQQLENVAEGFERALDQLRTAGAAPGATASKLERLNFEEECRVAEAASIHFRSVANQSRFVAARNALLTAKDPDENAPLVAALERVLRGEIILAQRLRTLQSLDSRIGFEASNHYFYVPGDLAEKVLNCCDLLDRWLPGLSRPS
jgi:hypothetical protein